jgi:tetratricopeptide (TPR) repeat protein
MVSTGSAPSMSNEDYPQGFVRSKLPWIAGAGALIVFLLTLNHWVSLRSLGMTARVAGWEMELPVQWPLFFTITFPFRFLPGAIQPIALNLFTALCAGLTVALLARSIALLPQDRTHEQRIRERSEFSFLTIPFAWAPVVLACGALAFQLTFWEHATSITGEMLDLLFFAYIIRCLLEYRIAHEEPWLYKLAFAYGLAITNNWGMIGFFPLFLGAIIWIKGVRFFDPEFLVRMALLGIAGLLLYLLLPAVWVMKGDQEYTFFQALRINWTMQKLFLIDTRDFRSNALLLSLTSVLPVVLMGIRWRTSVGDVNAVGSFLTTLAFRIINLFFLAVCLWIAFDPKYSPRALANAKGLPLNFLMFYYLGALAIGYYSGYALLVFTEPPRKGRFRETDLMKLINPVVRFAVLAAVILVPAGLIYKNFASVRGDNGAILREFTTRLAETLPPPPAYLFADEPYALALLQAHLGSGGTAAGYVLVNTRSIQNPAYHLKLRKLYGDKWPSLGTLEEMGAVVGENEIQTLVRDLAASNVVAYLQPSFGYFFESVYSVPNGQSYQLRPFSQQQILPPALSADQLTANNAYWIKTDDYIRRVARLKAADSLDAHYVARFYSRALNTWGVEMQRAGKIVDAGKYFENAFDLNTNNVPARVNRSFNKALQTGSTAGLETGKTIEEKFGGYRTWDKLLVDNGPYDHPEFCESLGFNLLSQTQFRQAALQFSRTIAFQATNFNARIAFAKCLVGGYWLDEAMAELDKITGEFPELPDAYKVELANTRANAYFKRNDLPSAEKILKTAQRAMPEQTALGESLFELYRVAGQYTNALATINEQLEKTPTNIVINLQKAELQLANRDFNGAHETLDRVLKIDPKAVSAQVYHAFAYIQEGNYDKAIATVDRVLREDGDNIQALLYRGIAYLEKKEYDKARQAFDDLLSKDPQNLAALRNRAILNLRAQRWSEAKDDYDQLRKITPKSHAVMYGLAEIAYNQGKRDDAIRLYESYLKYAPANGGPELDEEKKKVRQRLLELSTPGK